MARREWKWTEFQVDKLNKTMEILDELKEYKPLTLRQTYYQLVGKGYIDNNKSQYGMLSNLLKWARIDGYVSWDDVEDRVRAYHSGEGWSDKESFINQELDNFLKGYGRDLMQSQSKYIEVWIEKDALSSIFTKIANPYCISVVVCRGFSSVSFLNEFKNRLEYNADGKKAVMLYFGDFDPSGVEMLKAMKLTLETELNVKDIEFKRVALMKEDIFKYSLPHNPDAIKEKDTRTQKHVSLYGNLAVELDALRPDILTEKIKESIESELDIGTFNKEVEIESSEFDKLSGMRTQIIEYIKDKFNWKG